MKITMSPGAGMPMRLLAPSALLVPGAVRGNVREMVDLP